MFADEVATFEIKRKINMRHIYASDAFATSSEWFKWLKGRKVFT